MTPLDCKKAQDGVGAGERLKGRGLEHCLPGSPFSFSFSFFFFSQCGKFYLSTLLKTICSKIPVFGQS